MRRNKKNVIELIPILKDRSSFTNDKNEASSIQHLEISRTQKALATSNQSKKIHANRESETFLDSKASYTSTAAKVSFTFITLPKDNLFIFEQERDTGNQIS